MRMKAIRVGPQTGNALRPSSVSCVGEVPPRSTT
jgi:hypothetical protein